MQVFPSLYDYIMESGYNTIFTEGNNSDFLFASLDDKPFPKCTEFALLSIQSDNSFPLKAHSVKKGGKKESRVTSPEGVLIYLEILKQLLTTKAQ